MRLVAAGLVATFGAAAPAAAQNLLPDSSLTTLMRPQPLGRAQPLLPQDAPGGPPKRAEAPAAPCARGAVIGAPAPAARGAPAKPPRGAAYGGAGPGEYGKYLPGAAAEAAATAKPGEAAAPSAAGVDRPLYGGTQRPLWGSVGQTGTTAKAARPSAASSDPAAGGADSAASPNATPGAPAASAVPRDRPLWATGTPESPPAAAMAQLDDPSALGGYGAALLPCSPNRAAPIR